MRDNASLKLGPSHALGIRQVQVGCGPKNMLADWWNVDIRPFEGIDEVLDVTQPWLWSDVLTYVYGEHFLEHLTIVQAFEFLKNAHRAMQDGGIIRLSTPSLEWVLKTHFRFDRTDDDSVRSYTWSSNRAFYGWGHRFLYSRSTLQWLLQSSGFGDLKVFEYGQSNIDALKGLERHGGWSIQEGFPSVWIVEAGKAPFVENRWTQAKNECIEMFLKHVESGH